MSPENNLLNESVNGAQDGIRTHNTRLLEPMRLPIAPPGRNARSGIRTRNARFLRPMCLPFAPSGRIGAQGGIRTRRNQCLRLARLPIAPPGLITRQKTKAPSDVIAGGGRIQAYVRVLHAVLQLAAVRKQITQA